MKPLLPYGSHELGPSDLVAVSEVLERELLTGGEQVPAFEEELSRELELPHTVVVSSGTAALQLMLQSADYEPGDRVIVPAITFVATANAVRLNGLEVVFADVDPLTGLMTAGTLREAWDRAGSEGNGRVRAVIVVSLAGRSPDWAALAGEASALGLDLYHDACHVTGGRWMGPGGRSRSGIWPVGELCGATMSFHPVKALCTGEGGAVVVGDPERAERLRRLRSHGIERGAGDPDSVLEGGWSYRQTELATNYRMTDFQAALGRSQLRGLAKRTGRRVSLAECYFAELQRAGMDEMISVPAMEEGHAWHLFLVHFGSPEVRKRVHQELASRGILAQVHYIPVYRQPYYVGRYGEQCLAGAESYYRGVLTLPLHTRMDEADVERVVGALVEILGEGSE